MGTLFLKLGYFMMNMLLASFLSLKQALWLFKLIVNKRFAWVHRHGGLVNLCLAGLDAPGPVARWQAPHGLCHMTLEGVEDPNHSKMYDLWL